jgi:uncharacterized phage-associated protein
MQSPHAPYDARAISNFLLDLAEREDRPLTQLLLLKILYFAHGWYLAEMGRPLFSQPVEAWKHGPVVKVVRDAFKEFERRPIKSRAERLILETGELELVPPTLSDGDAEFVTDVYRVYVIHDAWTLSEMTHEVGSPWDKIWNATSAIGRLGLRIRNEEIRDHFLHLPRRFSVQ